MTWLTTHDVNDPLVGRIYDLRAKRFVPLATLLGRAASARFVLLGEKHDNPDHHRLQALVLDGIVRAGRRPRVAFEMLDVNEQPAIDAYRRQPDATASGFGGALHWEASGWPPYGEYEPIFDVAFSAGLDIAAANLEHDRARALVYEGLAALPPERVAALALERPFPPQLESELEAELAADHCGMLPAAMLAPMALAQHGRDSQMASRLLEAKGAGGAVLIAGGGHVRRDRGVPYYLALAGETSVLALDFVEVERGLTTADQYLRAGPGMPPADFLWFTPRANDADPCAGFRAPATKSAVQSRSAGQRIASER